MAKVLFIGKDTSVSKTICNLIDQLDDIYLSCKCLVNLELSSEDISNQDLCILNLSDWEAGNIKVLKKLLKMLNINTSLLVIDTYKDQHLIDIIMDLGAAAYIEQQNVAESIEESIRQLLLGK